MTRTVVLLSVLLALGTSGCDQIDDLTDDRTDTERLVGNGVWAAVSANVRADGIPAGIPVSNLANADDVQTFEFEPDGTFDFLFDPADGRAVTFTVGDRTVSFPLNRPVPLSGTYTVEDDDDEITFSTVAGQTIDDFRLGYRFTLTGSNLELIAEDPETLARLFGLADADAAQVAEVVTGGSITYSQD